jgi:hypothetical protein
MAINTTIATTAITIKMPTPIPALNMPAIASQELKAKEMNSKINTVRKFCFFNRGIFMGCLNNEYKKTLPKNYFNYYY